jgi:hypothetical protein
MIASTTERVARNTSDEINDRIRRQTEANISCFALAGAESIDRRLAELDREWDIERCLETMAPTISLLGLFLGLTRNRKWLLAPAVVQSFFLQHALQGWCPPIPVLRRLGIRTTDEIDRERYALKALRGDFQTLNEANSSGGDRSRDAIAAVRR